MTVSHRVAVLFVALCATSCGASKEPAPDGVSPAAAAAAKPADAPKPAADPWKDVAAWRALPQLDREAKAADLVTRTDASNASEVERVRALLAERGETAAVAALAKSALAKGSTSTWAREAAGHVNLVAEVDACLSASDAAEDADDARYLDLKAQRANSGGSWWADAGSAAKVRALCDEVKKTDAVLKTPYGEAIQKWARWQRAIDVMKDSPAIHAARGPYLIFVSLDPSKGPKLADVSHEEIERGTRILTKNLDLMSKFYDGWMETLGPYFGFTRYGPENSDDRTMLKMNVFTKSEDYAAYNDKVDPSLNGSARAYYSPMEPRFITTYDGGADQEDEFTTNQVQCHEATHQLVHFYTWDLSRTALKRDVSWLDCDMRPAWSEEGFAEFFSSHAVKDGKYLWMQPLDERLAHIYLLDEIVREKKWAPWEMKEFLAARDGQQLQELGRLRASRTPADRGIAESVMVNLFYAKAWSLVHFLWYAEEGGKPKHRDRYVEYLKREFHLEYKLDKVKHAEMPVPVGANDFRRIFGLTKDPDLAAFEKEWQAYVTKLVAAHKTPKWDEERARARKALGIDK